VTPPFPLFSSFHCFNLLFLKKCLYHSVMGEARGSVKTANHIFLLFFSLYAQFYRLGLVATGAISLRRCHHLCSFPPHIFGSIDPFHPHWPFIFPNDSLPPSFVSTVPFPFDQVTPLYTKFYFYPFENFSHFFPKKFIPCPQKAPSP